MIRVPKCYVFTLACGKAAAVLPHLKYLRHILVVGLAQEQEAKAPLCMTLNALCRAHQLNCATVETTKDDSAFWLYSSGSTGFPKGCVHLQHDMVYCTENYAKPILNISQDDITFSSSKLFFAYGLGNGLYFPLRLAAVPCSIPAVLSRKIYSRLLIAVAPLCSLACQRYMPAC